MVPTHQWPSIHLLSSPLTLEHDEVTRDIGVGDVFMHHAHASGQLKIHWNRQRPRQNYVSIARRYGL